MLLALSIVSEQGAALGSTAYKVFDERGGSIGRVSGNDWVLPDPQNFVSSRHALVRSMGGTFYLEDRSSNGTFINAPDRLTSRADPQPLRDGDRLFIGDYEIIVQLIPSAPAEMTARAASPAPAPAPVAVLPPPSGLGLGTVDPLAALGGAMPAAASAMPAAASARSAGPQASSSFPEPTRFEMPAPAPAGTDSTLHQTAMRAAARAGFAAMLAKLHPDTLEELYERKLKRTAMLGLGNKAKYWEMYRAQFEEIERDREGQFQNLFGEAFTSAYDEHLQKLNVDARSGKPR
jgi:predicted component of type VI protein secretion system